MERIAAAGNTEVPAYLTLRREGFELVAKPIDKVSEQWTAAKEDLILVAL